MRGTKTTVRTQDWKTTRWPGHVPLPPNQKERPSETLRAVMKMPRLRHNQGCGLFGALSSAVPPFPLPDKRPNRRRRNEQTQRDPEVTGWERPKQRPRPPQVQGQLKLGRLLWCGAEQPPAPLEAEAPHRPPHTEPCSQPPHWPHARPGPTEQQCRPTG